MDVTRWGGQEKSIIYSLRIRILSHPLKFQIACYAIRTELLQRIFHAHTDKQ